MPSLKSIARRFSDRAFGTAFDHALARSRHAPRNSFLFYWNRGMGDVALCLVPLFARIRSEAPGARIAVITRDELKAPFELADVDAVYVLPGLRCVCSGSSLDARRGRLTTGLISATCAAGPISRNCCRSSRTAAGCLSHPIAAC